MMTLAKFERREAALELRDRRIDRIVDSIYDNDLSVLDLRERLETMEAEADRYGTWRGEVRKARRMLETAVHEAARIICDDYEGDDV